MAKKNRKTLGIIVGLIGVIMLCVGLGPAIQRLVVLIFEVVRNRLENPQRLPPLMP